MLAWCLIPLECSTRRCIAGATSKHALKPCSHPIQLWDNLFSRGFPYRRLIDCKAKGICEKDLHPIESLLTLRDERTSDKTVRLGMVKSCTKLLSLPTPICFRPNKVTMNEPLTDVLSHSVMLIATPFWHILQSAGYC